MAARAVFLDTSCLIALLRSQDHLHVKARRVLRDLAKGRTPFITTDWVLAEFLAGMAGPAMRVAAADAAATLLNDSSVEVIEASRSGFIAALDLYRSRTDKAWSLVDCSSMQVCRERGLKRVFTHDRHFQQAGFEVLLR